MSWRCFFTGCHWAWHATRIDTNHETLITERCTRCCAMRTVSK